MIKRIEIKNFENHEHSILDFCDGFNLICGESNSGKSSILRAISAVAYNNFDVNTVRLGHKFWEVSITTEKGTVTARRGKTTNEWDVTPLNEPTLFYKSIGKEILETASKILSMNVIELGDVSMKINIMDQLESHFMLSSVNNDKISPSTRAQIVDEISGLAGIETIIKEVSSDHLKHKKENNVLNELNEELKEKLHDQVLLDKEENNLKEAKILLEKNENLLKQINSLKIYNNKIIIINDKLKKLEEEYDKHPDDETIKKLSNNIKNTNKNLNDLVSLNNINNNGKALRNSNKILQDNLNKLIETSVLEKKIEDCKIKLNLKNNLINIKNDYDKTSKDFNDNKKLLDSLPGIDQISKSLINTENTVKKYSDLNILYIKIQKILSVLRPQKKQLLELPDLGKVNDLFLSVQEKNNKLKEIKKIQYDIENISKKSKVTEKELKQHDDKLKVNQKELNEILSQYNICPICNQDIKKENL